MKKASQFSLVSLMTVMVGSTGSCSLAISPPHFDHCEGTASRCSGDSEIACLNGFLVQRGCPLGCSAQTGMCLPVCGNRAIEPPEECDDGNTISGDGCDAQCHRPVENVLTTVTTENQHEVQITTVKDGSFLIVFADGSHAAPQTSEEGIRARRLSNDGNPIQTDYVVSGNEPLGKAQPAMTANEDDLLLVVWTDGRKSSDNSSQVRGRFIRADGSLIGLDFPISGGAGLQEKPAVAGGKGGQFLVVWETGPNGTGATIRGCMVTETGCPPGSEFVVHAGSGTARHASVAPRSVGGYLVVWEDGTPGQNGTDISGRFVTAQGTLQGPGKFTINTTLAGNQNDPTVQGNQNEQFMVVWSDTSGADADKSGTGIRAGFTEADGSADKDFVVNTTFAGDQTEPRLAYAPNGTWFVVWNDLGDPSIDIDAGTVRGRRLMKNGTPLDPQDAILNTITVKSQEDPEVTASALGFLVVWEDKSGLAPDSSGDSLRGRLFPHGYQLPSN